jgi:hypothetical protein
MLFLSDGWYAAIRLILATFVWCSVGCKVEGEDV